jgi:hypothetical protein
MSPLLLLQLSLVQQIVWLLKTQGNFRWLTRRRRDLNLICACRKSTRGENGKSSKHNTVHVELTIWIAVNGLTSNIYPTTLLIIWPGHIYYQQQKFRQHKMSLGPSVKILRWLDFIKPVFIQSNFIKIF